ncbi:hypothetical protein TSUD_204950 [Trifolium subterraneum]|uniref:Uncharacterized protein n=1 Tax=Trifolium subterraneum TaxID=3900 RepID=A0A2Z6NUP3_TRISU|nr:hypothetical protein TSUD_204950 [Trifolium subterraneum]
MGVCTEKIYKRKVNTNIWQIDDPPHPLVMILQFIYCTSHGTRHAVNISVTNYLVIQIKSK